MSSFVVDASVTCSWILDDEACDYADAVMDRLAEDTALAPALWSLEISNVLLLAERRKRATSARILELRDQLAVLGIQEEAYSQTRVFASIIPLATAHGLTAYDAAYLELARRRSIPLATLDKALRRAADAEGVAILNASKNS
ncbi:MAG: type II toxin-antitoxin system VapC family toxin [Verrucomicrobiae bacterium]|nr:type II toxin-antitoxin system VapC family toxin [Verrucomicrobiae bacterium]